MCNPPVREHSVKKTNKKACAKIFNRDLPLSNRRMSKPKPKPKPKVHWTDALARKLDP
jgi:hypothetical protein